jgi:transposase
VNKWVTDLLAYGLEALAELPRGGRPAKLNDDQLMQLSEFIDKQAIKPGGGRLQAADIHKYIKEQFNVDYKQANIYRLMHFWGFSWITSRSKHP